MIRFSKLRRVHWLPIILVAFSQLLAVAADDNVELVLTPSEITAPSIAGYGGTELVNIEVYNRSAHPIEMPEKRWLVIERQDRPDAPCFTPLAPYTPLIIEPGQKVTVKWRLREATDVELSSGSAGKLVTVAAGMHSVFVYYRHAGEETWRRHTVAFEMQKLSWIWIALVAVVAIIVCAIWLVKS